MYTRHDSHVVAYREYQEWVQWMDDNDESLTALLKNL